MTKQTELSPEQRSKMLDMIREGTNLEMSKRLLELETENKKLKEKLEIAKNALEHIKCNWGYTRANDLARECLEQLNKE